jgi:hypothetical protein
MRMPWRSLTTCLGRLGGKEAQRASHGAVEAMVQAEGSELLRRLIQGHLDRRGSEEPPRARVVGADGSARAQRREGGKRRLETRFGEAIVTRRGDGGLGLESVFPLDAELNLPPDKYSHGLREVVLQEVVGGSFDEAVEHLARAGGGRMAKRQAKDVAVHLSQDFDAFYAQPLTFPQASRDEVNLLAIGADGKGIVMHPNGLREGPARGACARPPVGRWSARSMNSTRGSEVMKKSPAVARASPGASGKAREAQNRGA